MSSTRCLLSVAACTLSLASLAADELPPRAVARLGDYRFYHGDKLGCYAINYDGRRVATGDCGVSADCNKVIVWDGTTGEELRRWRIPGGGISCLDISPDGKRIAVGCCAHKDEANDLLVYDVDTGKLVHRLAEFKGGVTHVEFSLDGKRLHVSEGNGRWFSDPAVTCWDAKTGELRKRWKPPEIQPRETDKDYTKWTVEDGRLSVDEKILFWRMEVEVQTPKGSVDFAKRYTVLRAYDVVSLKQLYELKTYDWPSSFSVDGQRFVPADARSNVCDAVTGKVVHEWQNESSRAGIAALLPDKRRALVFTKNGYKMCDLETGKMHDALQSIPFTGVCHRFRVSGDGQTLLIRSERAIRLWNSSSDRESIRPLGHRLPVKSLWFSRDGKTLVSQCDEAICEWNVGLTKEMGRNSINSSGLDHTTCGTSGDGCFLFVSSGESTQQRETKTGKLVNTFETVLNKGAFSAIVSPHTDKVVLQPCLGRTGVEWFDLITGRRLGKLPNEIILGRPVFSSDSRILAWKTGETTIAIAEATSGRLLQRLHCEEVFDFLTLSADGDYVATWPDHLLPGINLSTPIPIRIYHRRSGKVIATFFNHPQGKENPHNCMGLAFSPDGRLLALLEKETNLVRVLETASGQIRLNLSGHRAAPTAPVFSPDGRTLATGGEDNVIYLWDVAGAQTRGEKELRSPEPLSANWDALAGADAVRAGDALAAMIRQPDRSVAFLKEQLRPVAAIDAKRLAGLIADLDADAFEKREAASRALTALGEVAEGALRQALKHNLSPEAKRRLDELLAKLDRHTPPLEMLRVLRAIEALEHIDTPQARRLLETLASGAPEARLTQDAKASLKRLERR